MSYSDYGERRRSSRRLAREPSGPARIQGSTAAAVLVFIAIAGFGIGALIGNSGGDPGGTTADDQTGAPAGSPDTEAADPGNTAAEDDPDEGDVPSVTVTLEMADSAPAGGELDYTVRTDPPQPGLVLGIERRQPGGDWEPFGEPQVQAEIDDDGEDSGYVITGVTGEAEWRVVGEINGERVESNVVTATITEEEDNSGPGNGNGNGEDNSGEG